MVNNVGYMGGSIGYLGGGTMNMDYSYVDHAVAPHYQLWKPPGAYYTRGEAPPPYEEAIAIAHAESLSSCTVREKRGGQVEYTIAASVFTRQDRGSNPGGPPPSTQV
uniref:Uncharacterized protein n=1 Tax=Anopheles maculatus TaxID=74869 RepID=A0A182SL96_9DIPT